MATDDPVAEVVERLRNLALACADDPDPDKRAILQEGPIPQALSGAADLLERLSRERDTGVPEGWRLVPMIGAEVRADHPITSLNPDPTFEVFAIRAEAGQRLYVRGENTCWFNIDGVAPAAAPQPPTVSTQGWQDITTAPKDGSQILARTKDGSVQVAWWSDMLQAWSYGGGYWADNVVEWSPIPNSRAPALDLSTLTQLKEELERVYKVDDQKTREINILTSENRKVYRERDQARELLTRVLAAYDGKAFVARKFGSDWKSELAEEIRSVLHPEKEEKA